MNDITQRLDLKQTQTLVMTPQLQQAIKMLQLTNTELAELIEKELEHNPLLEKVDPNQTTEADTPRDTEEKQSSESKDSMDEAYDDQWDGEAYEKGEKLQDFDAGSSMANVGAGGNTSFDNLEASWENSLANTKTLRDHLSEQALIEFTDAKDLALAMQLIDRVDEKGFLRDSKEELLDKIGCKEERLDDVLKRAKDFDPTGIFAADLPECFALQLAEKGQLDESMQRLLDNLDLLAEHDHKKLCKLCDVTEDELSDMVGQMRALNPNPASDFDHFVVQTAIPDVLMRAIPKSEGGGWRVVLNTDTLPRVLVNEEYHATVMNSAVKKEDKTYMNERLASAHWLVRAMDQRAQTILKVASKIIEHQYAFFLYGVEYLTPLTLREIAEEIEMHESTVSRVTTNKYIGTPRGIFELKYFFSSGVGTSGGGGDLAAEAVKAKIKALIDQEKTAKDVHSDDKLAELLGKDGVDIARRTVAKYREAMGLGSSVQRRKILRNKAKS